MEPYQPVGQRDVNLTTYKQELRNQAGTENPLWAEKSTRTGVKMTAQFQSRHAAVEYESKIKAIVGRQGWQHASICYFQKLNQYVADCLYRLGEAPETGKTGLRFCEVKLSPAYQSYDYRHADPEHESVKGAEMYKEYPELMAEPSPQDPTLRPLSEFVGEQKQSSWVSLRLQQRFP